MKGGVFLYNRSTTNRVTRALSFQWKKEFEAWIATHRALVAPCASEILPTTKVNAHHPVLAREHERPTMPA